MIFTLDENLLRILEHPQSDWEAWLKVETYAGKRIYVKIQIGYNATEKEAKEILEKIVGKKEK